jgi:flagellar hook-basal body complex protein FliE
MAGVSPLPPLPAISALDPAGSAGPVGGAAQAAAVNAGATATASAPGGGSFVDALGDALSRLNTQLASADASMAGFAAGTSADIGSVMLQMQEASLGLKLGIQVRDRLLDAYRDVMHLQV